MGVLYDQVRNESEQYLADHSVRQTWNGTEPAFRLLIQKTTSPEQLPKYAATAEYLHPDHCRLCLEEYEDLDAHIRDHHPDIQTRD